VKLRLVLFALTHTRYTRHLRKRLVRSTVRAAAWLVLGLLALAVVIPLFTWGLANWRFVRGNELLDEGRWNDAVQEFNAALELAPDRREYGTTWVMPTSKRVKSAPRWSVGKMRQRSRHTRP
jgi:hypothetical protein